MSVFGRLNDLGPLGLLDRESMTRERSSKWDDMHELAGLLAAERPWKQRMNDIRINGVPMGLQGGLAGLEANPPGADLSPVTINATEAALWPAATWTPIPALLVGPKAYYLKAYGVCTSAATPGTQTFNPRIGTTSAGISMGISGAWAPTASETAVVWRLEGDTVLRGPMGGTATIATGYFEYHQTTGTTGNTGLLTGTNLPPIFGGTSAGFDNTAAQALFMGCVAATSTTNTMTPRLVIWASWN